MHQNWVGGHARLLVTAGRRHAKASGRRVPPFSIDPTLRQARAFTRGVSTAGGGDMDVDESFVEFVSARWRRLYRFAYLLTADANSAEDLLQTAMEKTYARWAKVRRMEQPEAYVRRSMVNALTSARRRPGWHLEWSRDVLPEPRDPASDDDFVVDRAMLWPLVCALPARQRAVVVLRYYEDLTTAETAEMLGCAVGTVKSHSHDAMQTTGEDTNLGLLYATWVDDDTLFVVPFGA